MPEEFELETLAEDLAGIEAEPGINPYGEAMTEEVTIDYESIAQEAIDQYILSSLEARYNTEEQLEEITLSPEEDFALDSPMVGVKAAPLAAAAPAQNVMPEQKAYKLDLDGREVYAFFAADAELGVTDDGYIYNETGANITGIIADSLDSFSLNSYNDTVTVAPLLNSSGNNNAYRYGSRVYVTDYYSSGTTLQNSVTYISEAKLLDSPGAGYGFSRFQIVSFTMLLLMVFLLIVRFARK